MYASIIEWKRYRRRRNVPIFRDRHLDPRPKQRQQPPGELHRCRMHRYALQTSYLEEAGWKVGMKVAPENRTSLTNSLQRFCFARRAAANASLSMGRAMELRLRNLVSITTTIAGFFGNLRSMSIKALLGLSDRACATEKMWRPSMDLHIHSSTWSWVGCGNWEQRPRASGSPSGVLGPVSRTCAIVLRLAQR